MSDRLISILQQLDPENDAEWTSAGLPRLETVEELLGASVSRAELTAAAPSFTREAHAASLAGAESSQDSDDTGEPGQADPGEGPGDAEDKGDAPPLLAREEPAPLGASPESADGMRARRVQLAREIEDAQRQIAELRDGIAQRQVASDVLAERIAKLAGRDTSSPAQEYIASQNALRAARVARAAGVPVQALGAPVDAVRRRQTGFGNRAPKPRGNMAEAARAAADDGAGS